MSKEEDEAVKKAVEAMRQTAEAISDLMDRDLEAGVRAANEWIGELSRILPADHDGIVTVRTAIAIAVANPNTKKEYADS